jgi:hypothetical protein
VLILPRPEEIEAGILIPGHRFLPLYDRLLSPPELTVRAGTRRIERRRVSRTVGELQVYYSLFGVGSFPHYLALEEEGNAGLFTPGMDRERSLAAVSVLDMRSLYRKWQIQPGYGLWATLTNWRKGEFTLVPAGEPAGDDRAAARFVERLDRGFAELMEEVEWPLPPEEELSRAFFRAGREIIEKPPLHPGGYLARSERIGLVRFGVDTFLWSKERTPKDFARSRAGMLDARLSDSRLEELLRAWEISVPLPAIEACAREAIRSDSSFLSLVGSLLVGVDLSHLTDKQYYRFISALESFARQVHKRWNPEEEDGHAAYLHRQTLYIYREMVAWLAEVQEHSETVNERDLEDFSGLLLRAVRILELLHSLGAEPERERINYIEGEVSALLGRYPQCIERLRQALQQSEDRRRRKERTAEAKAEEYLLLEVEMEGLDPPVTRSLRVPGSMDLADLHRVLQTTFDWTDSHLHAFLIAGKEYGNPEYNDFEPPEDERHVRVAELPELCSEFTYIYDFGDDWNHRIRITGRVGRKEVPAGERESAVCLEARGAAPPEDCGGAPGYEELVEALRTSPKQRSEEQQELMEFSNEWHPDGVRIEEINRLLQEL